MRHAASETKKNQNDIIRSYVELEDLCVGSNILFFFCFIFLPQSSSVFQAKLTVLYLGGIGDERSEMHLFLPYRFVQTVRVASRCIATDRISECQCRRWYRRTAIQISQVIGRKIFKLVAGAPIASQRIEIVEGNGCRGSVIRRFVVRTRGIGCRSGRTLGRFSLQLKSHEHHNLKAHATFVRYFHRFASDSA